MSAAKQLERIRGRHRKWADLDLSRLPEAERDLHKALAIIEKDRVVLREIRAGTLYHSEAVELARKRLAE